MPEPITCTNCMGSGWDPNGCVINGPDCDLDDHLIEHTHCCPICDGTGKRVPDLMDALMKSFADAKAARSGATMPEPTVRCSGTLGEKPWWMSWGQYDPCPCRLPAGHDGDHWCEHLDTPDPRENGHAIAPEDPHQNGS